MVASASLPAAEDKSTAETHAHARALSGMTSTTALPPLRLRPVASLRGLGAAATSPSQRSASPFTTDEEDAERRNATALTIVELLARAGDARKPDGSQLPQPPQPPQSQAPQSQSQSQSLESEMRRSPLLVAPRPVLPSLPKMKVAPAPGPAPGADSPWFLPPPNAFLGMVSGKPALTTPPAAGPAVHTAPAPAATVNNSRKRQKDELTRLRAQVQELQRELEHVRGRLPHKQSLARYVGASSGQSTAALGPMDASAASAIGMASVPVWERMAQHQKEEKSKAEMENLRLKGLIQEQVKISRGLEKLLKKRCRNMAENPFPGKRRRECDLSEAALFDSLLSSVDTRVHELDAVFEKSGLSRDKHELQETQMILDERRGPVMEVKDARILPFSVATCSAALWRCFELEGIDAQDTASELARSLSLDALPASPAKKPKLSAPQPPADTIYMKGMLPFRQHRAPDAELEIRGVVKRFADLDKRRVVLLWESVIECPSKLLNCAAKDAEVRDYGWGVLEPLPGAVPGDHSTIVQLCSYIAPRVGGGSLAEECRQHVHSLADLVVPSFRDVWGKRQRVLENLLMDSAVSGRGSAAGSPGGVVKVELPHM